MTVALRTARLVLMPMALDDEALFVQLYTDPSVMAQVQAPLTGAAAIDGFQAALAEGGDTATQTSWWILRERTAVTPGEVVVAQSIRIPAASPALGLVGLRHAADSAEVGALLLPPAQRRGFAVEAIATLIDHALARAELQTLVIRHERTHPPGAAVAMALGFVRGDDVGSLARWTVSRAAWANGALRAGFASRPSQV